MSTRVGIVWNPSKTEKSELSRALEQALAEASADPGNQLDITPMWFETIPDDPGQQATAAALAEGCCVVIAAGGDGTVRAVAEALSKAAGARDEAPASEADTATAAPNSFSRDVVPLGIVPLGTGNLLARNLRVPLGSPQAAFARVLTGLSSGTAAPLDVGEATVVRADGKETSYVFVVMVGFGIDAQMIVETDDDLKARAGWLAYVESLGRAVAGTEVVDLQLSLDEHAATDERAHTLLIGNCGSIQGGITLLPDAQPDDGLLDVLLLSADGLAAWLDTMHNMVWQNGLMRLLKRESSASSSESATHTQARSVSVQLETPLSCEVDGEEIGEVTALTAVVVPGALRVY